MMIKRRLQPPVRRLALLLLAALAAASGACTRGPSEGPRLWRLADHLEESSVSHEHASTLDNVWVLDFERGGDLASVAEARGVEGVEVRGGALRFLTNRRRPRVDLLTGEDAGLATDLLV